MWVCCTVDAEHKCNHLAALALAICFCARAIVCRLRSVDNAIAATFFCFLSAAILAFSGVMGAAAVWDSNSQLLIQVFSCQRSQALISGVVSRTTSCASVLNGTG